MQGGAVTGKIIIAQPHQALLGRFQLIERITLVDGLDPGEQQRVLMHLGVVVGQFGRYFPLDCPELRRRQVGAPDTPVGQYALQLRTGLLDGQNGIFKSRRLKLAGDCIQLRQAAGHGAFHRRLEIGEAHLIESRHTPIGTAPRGQQTIGLRRRNARWRIRSAAVSK